jgi:hypothetical protein
MRKATNTDLVDELTALNTDGRLDEIIAEARAGEYHDYKNQKYACGKMALVEKLDAFPELGNIRLDVINGVYDESPDTDDKAQMKADLLKDMSPEAAAVMIKELGLE